MQEVSGTGGTTGGCCNFKETGFRRVTERVAYLIGHHHTYDKIEGMDYQILVEADFLVNIQ